MKQASFPEMEYDRKKRRTRRDEFLENMDGLMPWRRLEKRIEPFYPKAGRGRRPYPLGMMLRMLCVIPHGEIQRGVIIGSGRSDPNAPLS